MPNNLGEIYTYLNTNLLDGELEGIDGVIGYLEECQQKISEKFPIEAPILSVILESDTIAVPVDMRQLVKIVVDDNRIQPKEVWGGTIYLPAGYQTKTAKVYYHRKPTVLDPLNLSQVPDVDSKFFNIMADYAAQRYYLADDDEDMRAKFEKAFWDGMTAFSGTGKVRESNYTNVW